MTAPCLKNIGKCRGKGEHGHVIAEGKGEETNGGIEETSLSCSVPNPNKRDNAQDKETVERPINSR